MRLQYRKIWPVLLGRRTAILPWAESWLTLYANKTNLILVDILKFSLHLFFGSTHTCSQGGHYRASSYLTSTWYFKLWKIPLNSILLVKNSAEILSLPHPTPNPFAYQGWLIG